MPGILQAVIGQMTGLFIKDQFVIELGGFAAQFNDVISIKGNDLQTGGRWRRAPGEGRFPC